LIHSTAIIETENIGKGTKIWAFSHVSEGAVIGDNCMIGEGVHIGNNVIIGDNCRIQNHSLIYEGVVIGSNVFLGPNTVTTNDIFPRVRDNFDGTFRETFIEDYVSVGANSTIICGITLRKNSMIAAGSVVTNSTEANSLVKGNPARHIKYLNGDEYRIH